MDEEAHRRRHDELHLRLLELCIVVDTHAHRAIGSLVRVAEVHAAARILHARAVVRFAHAKDRKLHEEVHDANHGGKNDAERDHIVLLGEIDLIGAPQNGQHAKLLDHRHRVGHLRLLRLGGGGDGLCGHDRQLLLPLFG